MKSEMTVRAAAMGYYSDQLNGIHEARRVKDKALTDRAVTSLSTTDGIDSSTPASRMMIGVLGSLAKYKRELVKERTALKRQAFRANSTKFGRPKKVKDGDNIATARRMKADGPHCAGHRQVPTLARLFALRYGVSNVARLLLGDPPEDPVRAPPTRNWSRTSQRSLRGFSSYTGCSRKISETSPASMTPLQSRI